MPSGSRGGGVLGLVLAALIAQGTPKAEESRAQGVAWHASLFIIPKDWSQGCLSGNNDVKLSVPGDVGSLAECQDACRKNLACKSIDFTSSVCYLAYRTRSEAGGGYNLDPGCQHFEISRPATLTPPHSTPQRAQSEWVKEEEAAESGYRLSYKHTEHGDVISDFSSVGYEHGSDLPKVPAVHTITPIVGDNTAHLQAAIDAVAKLPLLHNGNVAFRGALQLAAGQYYVSSPLIIRASGIVLRGSGSGTVLRASATHGGAVVHATGKDYRYPVGPAIPIVEHVHAGASTVTVHAPNVSNFAVGDNIVVYRRATAEWISKIGMDAIPNCGPEATKECTYWDPQWYHISYERVVTAVSGNVLEVDLPIVSSIDVGIGTVFKYAFPERISHVGIESLALVSDYDPDWKGDEQHAKTAVQLNRLQHSFVRNITCAQFWYSCVNVGENAKHVTVLDSRSIKPVSKVTGGRRYSFILHGGASLVSRCQAERGRHDFVTQHRTPGPNVFFNSHSRHAYNDVGPHHRWAQGLLFDGITTKRAAFSGGWCNIQDRGAMGSGHGWTATSAVFYNCEASHGMRVESPPGSTNWGIGCKAPKLWGDGVWESKNVPVSPPSLYLAQRRAAGLPFRSPEQSIDEFGGKTAALCAIELDVDFDGFDLWDEAATSVANCVAPCSSSPTCTYFTYVWGRCFYKSSSEGRHELTSAASGTCRAEAAEAARTPTTTTTTTAISSTSNPSKAGNPGLNATVAPAPIMLGVASGAEIECSVGMRAPTYGSFMPEYNLDSNQPMTGTLAQCIAACTGECVAFSWLIFADPQTTHTCYLKRFGPQTGKHDSIHWTSYITACGAHALTVPTVGDESASAKPGAAPPAQVEPAAPAVPRIVEYLGCTLTTGMDYEGADLWKEFGVDAKDCVNSCIQDPLCTYFSYLETTCYYKQTSVGQ